MRFALVVLLCLGAARADIVMLPPDDTHVEFPEPGLPPPPYFPPHEIPLTPLWPVVFGMVTLLAFAVFVKWRWQEETKQGPRDDG